MKITFVGKIYTDPLCSPLNWLIFQVYLHMELIGIAMMWGLTYT